MRIGLCSSGGHVTPPIAYGSEVTTWYLAEEFAAAGHEVILVAAKGSRIPPGGQLLEIPLNLMRCTETEKLSYPLVLPTLFDCDVLHDCSSSHCFADASHEFGPNRHLATINGISFFTPRHKHNVCVLSEAARIAGIQGASAWGDDYPELRANPGYLPSSRVVPYGTDTRFYTPTPGDVGDYLVYVGRPDPSKGVHIILEIARQMPQETFVLAWRPEYVDHQLKSFEYKAAAAKVPNVTFVDLPAEGHHEAKRALYQRAKAFLQPTQYIEAFGLTAAEALACGTPVILANKGSGPEIVREGITGFLCTRIEDYRKAIEEISVLSRAEARRDAVKRFDKSVMASTYLALYADVLAGKEW